jgi:phage terminase small subunit
MPSAQSLSPKAAKTRPPRPGREKRGANAFTPISEVRSRGIDTGSAAGIAQIDPDKPLTELQRRFVKIWAEGETILSAAIRAGYTDGGAYAYRLAKYPNIRRLYDEEKRLYEEASQMSRKKVMDMLLEGYEHAKLAGEPASMIAAAREVGKMCGYYEPVKHRVDINVSGTVIHDRLNRMSDAELLKLITTSSDSVAMLEGSSSDAEDNPTDAG